MKLLLWLTWVAALTCGWIRAQGTGWALALLTLGSLATVWSIRWCVHDPYKTSVKIIVVLAFGVLAPLTLRNWLLAEEQRSTSPDDLLNVSYAELREALGDGVHDPIGGEHIFVRQRFSRNSWDYWYKIAIDEKDYRAMWSMDWADQQARMPTARPLADVRGIPPAWHQPGDAPDWFDLPYESQLEWNGWECQIKTGPRDFRAHGAVWVYDYDSNTLYIWDWNHPHCDLGW